jgi:esterase/lipase
MAAISLASMAFVSAGWLASQLCLAGLVLWAAKAESSSSMQLANGEKKNKRKNEKKENENEEMWLKIISAKYSM